MTSPILFLIFRKVQQTRAVFEQIRQARPPRLYLAADGPRPNVEGEEEACAQTRAIVSQVDWPCEVFTLFRDHNLGVTMAITQAVTWFFDHEEMGIVLEDDTLPDPSLFAYMDEMLPRYQHDDRAWMVCGCNMGLVPQGLSYSYIFYPYAFIWAWGSWRRSWQRFQAVWQTNDEFCDVGGTLDAIHVDRHENESWRHVISRLSSGELDSYDYCFSLSMNKQAAYAIFPTTNMVTNIGFSKELATHTHDGTHPFANLVSVPMPFPLRHPDYVHRSRVAEDNFIFKGQFPEEHMSVKEVVALSVKKVRSLVRRAGGHSEKPVQAL